MITIIRDNKKSWKFLILAFLFLFFFYTYLYNDIIETSRKGIDFWYDLFEGKIRYFYIRSTPVDVLHYARDVVASYEFPIYLFFAVWNLPLFLLEKFARVDIYTSVLCLMWIKSILLVFLYLNLSQIYQMCKVLDIEEKRGRLACVLFLSSSLVISSLVLQSGYEVISLFLH